MPSVLLEHKAARLVMRGGNLEQSQLRGLIEANEAFFFSGEERDFAKCEACSALLDEYPGAFLPNLTDDLGYQGALFERASAAGLITKRNRLFASAPVRFASVAARGGHTGVLVPPTAIIDTLGICDAGAVATQLAADFIQVLRDTAI